MKPKRILQLIFAVALLSFTGCGDDESGPAFPSQPEARPANDNSGKGIYKGVLIGSTGFVKINIDNEGNGNISFTLNIDGTSYNLTTSQTYNTNNGFEGIFSGPFGSGTASIGFYVNASGTSYDVFAVDIPGHPNVCIIPVKEMSNSLLRCFTGTYSGDDSGIMNFVVGTQNWSLLVRANGETDCSLLEGDISGNTLEYSEDWDGDGTADVILTGTINGNTLSGTWTGVGVEGTFTAERVL